jgi:predicted signal transduction protein with EAL and GGDEF domain
MISPTSPKTSESTDHDPESDFAVLDLWPDEPDLGPGVSVWLGALVIALTGVAVIVLLSVTLLQSGYRIARALWIWIGLPLVLAVTAAVRISAGRLRQAPSRHVGADVDATH